MSLPILVLASASPRRADVLRMLGVDFEVRATDVPEVRSDGETPADYVERLARAKASAGAEASPDRWVLAGDTVVAFEGDVLEKPESVDHAVDMLLSLSGREHTVFSGLALCDPDGRILSRVDHTVVRFREFDSSFARAYVDTGEPLDKAGAYGIQGLGAALVDRVEGEFYTVVGMSVAGLVDLLDASGLTYAFPRP